MKVRKMLLREETEKVLHTKSNGDKLVVASSGDGYTAFTKDNVRIGHISAETDAAAVAEFSKKEPKYEALDMSLEELQRTADRYLDVEIDELMRTILEKTGSMNHEQLSRLVRWCRNFYALLEEFVSNDLTEGYMDAHDGMNHVDTLDMMAALKAVVKEYGHMELVTPIRCEMRDDDHGRRLALVPTTNEGLIPDKIVPDKIGGDINLNLDGSHSSVGFLGGTANNTNNGEEGDHDASNSHNEDLDESLYGLAGLAAPIAASAMTPKNSRGNFAGNTINFNFSGNNTRVDPHTDFSGNSNDMSGNSARVDAKVAEVSPEIGANVAAEVNPEVTANVKADGASVGAAGGVAGSTNVPAQEDMNESVEDTTRKFAQHAASHNFKMKTQCDKEGVCVTCGGEIAPADANGVGKCGSCGNLYFGKQLLICTKCGSTKIDPGRGCKCRSCGYEFENDHGKCVTCGGELVKNDETTAKCKHCGNIHDIKTGKLLKKNEALDDDFMDAENMDMSEFDSHQGKLEDIEFVMTEYIADSMLIEFVKKVDATTWLVGVEDEVVTVKFDPSWSEYVYTIEGRGPYSHSSYEYISRDVYDFVMSNRTDDSADLDEGYGNDEMTEFLNWIQDYKGGCLWDAFTTEFNTDEDPDIDDVLNWLEDFQNDAYYAYIEKDEYDDDFDDLSSFNESGEVRRADALYGVEERDELVEAVYTDTSGIMGVAGETYTTAELRKIWNDNHNDDPSMVKYNGDYDKWVSDTLAQMSRNDDVDEAFDMSYGPDLSKLSWQVASYLDVDALGEDKWIEFICDDPRDVVGGTKSMRFEAIGETDHKYGSIKTAGSRVEVKFRNGSEAMCDSAEEVARFIAGEFGISI